MGRLIARVQPPIAAVTARPRDGGAVHQAEPWAPRAGWLASHVGQQMAQHIGKEVAGLAQTIEQRDIAQLGDTGFGGVAGDTAQRQAAGAIQQPQVQQVRRTAHTAFAQQRFVVARAGVQIQ